ncbi:MAG: hypothetical protein QOH25_2037 [Acidobacteriota bacterium]|jgi:hypothetical protein|nr:hypothetical protein [Acidobacteriota bacterium]
MLLLILVGIFALVSASYLLGRADGSFADGLLRIGEAVFDFVEYKAALRSVRTVGLKRSL